MTAEFVLFIAIIKLLSPRRLFAYFKRRYSRSQVETLNDALRKRYLARNISHNIIFLMNVTRKLILVNLHDFVVVWR